MGSPHRKSGKQVKWRSMVCGHCKQAFNASRDDALFCGAACRKAEQRIREAVEAQMILDKVTAAPVATAKRRKK